MKRIVLLVLITIIMLPAAVFAADEIESEVQSTLAITLSTFGIVFVSTLFGAAPDGVKAAMDEKTGKSSIYFENFNPSAFFSEMPESSSGTGLPNDGVFTFDTMTGTVSADQMGNMFIDMKYSGGSVRTMKLATEDENIKTFTANGKDYSYIENLLNVE
ncbi:MAG: hypothetical protein PQJ61_10315 [Spirochaetales bacterium]|uniref:Uncharacterized protein n=1 Tax=Candidatus Thalassospirochaeta sargassi TaxID=3119039 RepID=A0AAJ1ID70_9SPIO|nr:hypothetical protein [Spirochaetales bacterium]